MEERLSILEEEKFVECRFCDHLVSSENPICKHCGLEMSSEGIIELAEIEENESKDFDKIYRLTYLAVFNFTSVFVGIVYIFLGVQTFFKFFFWLSLFLYVAGYFLWKKKTSEKKFSEKEKQVVNEQLELFFGSFIITTIAGILVYIFLLK